MIIHIEKRNDLFENLKKLPALKSLSIGDFLTNIKKNNVQRIFYADSEDKSVCVCYYNTNDIDYNFLEYYFIYKNDFFKLNNFLNVEICWNF